MKVARRGQGPRPRCLRTAGREMRRKGDDRCGRLGPKDSEGNMDSAPKTSLAALHGQSILNHPHSGANHPGMAWPPPPAPGGSERNKTHGKRGSSLVTSQKGQYCDNSAAYWSLWRAGPESPREVWRWFSIRSRMRPRIRCDSPESSPLAS